MLEEKYFNRISKVLPFLQTASAESLQEFRDQAYFVKIPAGQEIFVEGDEVNGIALLISGSVRVYKASETGREITLYRFGEGESCVITANAILHHQDFPAIAVTEQESDAIMIPAKIFNDWVKKYDLWRDFVLKLVSDRLAIVMEIVEEVAFKRLDKRLAEFLKQRSSQTNPIYITHQEIANEIGSSREVISRLLVDLSKQEIVSLSRGKINVINIEGLINYLAL